MTKKLKTIQPAPSVRDRGTGAILAFLRPLNQSRFFLTWYPRLAPLILLATVVYWSVLGASTQLDNADNLVDPYLFKDGATFHGANFPGQHTQLLKWPIFYLIKVAGFSSFSYIALTVLMVLATIGILVYLIYRIERRPLVRATACLGLASILLLIPARPYAAGLLPVNMAMLATRNIEYIVYVGALVLLARTKHLRNWSFWLATAGLTVLIASDKLFLTIGLGAALVALLVYALVRRWELVILAAYWLTAQIVAALAALNLLALINYTHLTHIVNQGGLGPYSAVIHMHQFIVGTIFAALEVLTNTGANPVPDVMVLRELPHQLFYRLLTPSLVASAVNMALTLVSIIAIASLFRRSLGTKKIGNVGASIASKLSLMLIWTSLAAIAVFIASDHDYAVDARYLAIILFTVLISAVTVGRRRKWSTELLACANIVLLVAVALGLIVASATSHREQGALAEIDQRDQRIANVINLHPTKTLVGDYWRVLPIEQKTSSGLRVTPLAECTLPRADLSSSVWQPDLAHTSFTYLLSYDQNLTNYPSCALKQIMQAYGRPNASILIAGTSEHPLEQLLIYDRGTNQISTSSNLTKVPGTILPLSLDELPNTACAVPSIMPIVAHQDDDLLFMNPDIAYAIKAGYCVRTIYLTAGDGGNGDYYWIRRQLGSEAAYAKMLGIENAEWVERIVKLADNQIVTVANPRGNSKISLIFMHLPDGNLVGQGFGDTKKESLSKLLTNRISYIHSVDNQSSYSGSELVGALNALMIAYSPAEIYGQSTYRGHRYPDHSDHLAVGQFTNQAYALYEKAQFDNLVTIPLRHYIGYPIHELSPNISRGDLDAKLSIFLSYAEFDGGVCRTIELCQKVATYGSYLSRQYQYDK